jgi:uncharacterized membrane protein (UPF0127 family)
MGADNKIAATLRSKHPDVLRRGVERLPLQRGDRVVDAAYEHIPIHMPDGEGNILRVAGADVTVQWDDGTVSTAPYHTLKRVSHQYVQTPHDSAYLLPPFRPNDHVLLGNGNHGKVLAEVTGPTGFKSYRVQITDSKDPGSVGRAVFATYNGMIKVSGLIPDVVCQITCPVKGPIAVVGCELATTPHAQTVGLQKYSSLPSDHGMLFPYDPPQAVSFHMGNVQFPIDVLFITEHGTIQKIEAQREPGYDEQWRSVGRVAAVLEVNGGFCADRGIVPGMRVSVGTPKVAQEVFDPLRPDVHNYQSPATSRPVPSERFTDRQDPAAILEDSQPIDNKYHETQSGYDIMTYHDDPDAPNMRSGVWVPFSGMSPVVGDYETKRCAKCNRDTIHAKDTCRVCSTHNPSTPPKPAGSL